MQPRERSFSAGVAMYDRAPTTRPDIHHRFPQDTPSPKSYNAPFEALNVQSALARVSTMCRSPHVQLTNSGLHPTLGESSAMQTWQFSNEERSHTKSNNCTFVAARCAMSTSASPPSIKRSTPQLRAGRRNHLLKSPTAHLQIFYPPWALCYDHARVQRCPNIREDLWTTLSDPGAPGRWRRRR